MIVTSIDFREILFRGVLLDCPSIKFYEEEDCINGLRKDNENRHLSIESLCHLIVRLLDWLNFYTRRSGMYFEFRRNNEFEGTLGKIVYNSNLQYRIDKKYITCQSVYSELQQITLDTFCLSNSFTKFARSLARQPDRFHVLPFFSPGRGRGFKG